MRSKLTKILSVILIFSILFSFVPTKVFANSIKINKTKATIYVGKKVQLKVTGTKKKVTWKSNKKSVATVNSRGKVTGKSEGKANIIAKVSGKTLKCVVTVKFNDIRPEFKEAMDSYEAFFDEYVSFMEKYLNSDDAMSLLSEHNSYMTQYIETIEKMDSISEEELSNEELLYYLEVHTRISRKLMSITQ